MVSRISPSPRLPHLSRFLDGAIASHDDSGVQATARRQPDTGPPIISSDTRTAALHPRTHSFQRHQSSRTVCRATEARLGRRYFWAVMALTGLSTRGGLGHVVLQAPRGESCLLGFTSRPQQPCPAGACRRGSVIAVVGRRGTVAPPGH